MLSELEAYEAIPGKRAIRAEENSDVLGAEISRMKRASLKGEIEAGKEAWGKFLSVFGFVFIIF